MNALALPARSGLAIQLLSECSEVEISQSIEILIELLDSRAPDPDREPDDEDCCCALDDRGGASMAGYVAHVGPGEPEDAEDSDDDCCLCRDGPPVMFDHFPEMWMTTIAADI